MKVQKRYIFILIIVALLSLIGLQMLWLAFVYQYKAQELKDKTREAALETTYRLQKEEDSKLILNNIDSLLVTENLIGSDSSSAMRVIVSSIKNNFKIDTVKGISRIEHKLKIIDDSSESTTIVKVGNDKTKRITISGGSSFKEDFQKEVQEFQRLVKESNVYVKEFHDLANEYKKEPDPEKRNALQKKAFEAEKKAMEIQAQAKEHEDLAKAAERQAKEMEHSEIIIENSPQKTQKKIIHLEKKNHNVKKKAGELEALFLKMAVNAQGTSKNITSRINFKHVQDLLKEELLKRGIDLIPEIGISSSPKQNRPNSDDYYVIFNTPGFVKLIPDFISLPLFPGDNFNNINFQMGFRSTTNYVIKQMIGLLALSLLLSLLIAFVIIYIFRKMLSQDKLHQLKNDFINNMTHELKTPIATISLALDGITNPQIKNDDEKFNNYCNILKEENKKLNNHVEHVLQMSLLEQGLIPLNKKPTDLVSLINESITTYQLQIQNKKAIVSFNCSNEEIIVNADEFYLGNVFNNLLDNALKYSADFCKIDISITKNTNEILISFKDDGIGIERSQQNKVFEKFYRVQSGNLHDTKGFGLGLSYVKSIVEAHGGMIELKSELNKGSEFIIKLNEK